MLSVCCPNATAWADSPSTKRYAEILCINLEIGNDSFLSPFDAVISNLKLNRARLNGNEQRLVMFEYQ